MNKNVLKKLAEINDSSKIEKTLVKFANKIFVDIKKVGNESEIYTQLELLEAFSYRVPNQVLEIVEFVLKNKCKKELADKEWINYGTVISKCFELLKSIRYLKIKEVFDLLTSLDLEVKKTIEARNETLKSLLKYNFGVLKQIGLFVQENILDEIVGWKAKEKIKNVEIIKIAVKEFLQPSYEWSDMVGWNKLQFSSGSLVGDKDGHLAKIRKKSIDLIFESYGLIRNEKERFELIKILDEASRTPHSGVNESLEKIIEENKQYLLKKYKEIVFDKNGAVVSSLPVAMEIERQLLWFVKRWPKDKKRVDAFMFQLKSDEKYFVYRNLVDRERLDYLETGERTKKEEVDFTEKIEVNKFWRDILNSITQASEIDESWKFNGFHKFLSDLSEKQVKKGEYFLKNALKDNDSLMEFADAFILGFRNIGRTDLWDKYVSEIEKKRNGNLMAKIFHSFYFYFKNTKEPKFREKDFAWLKNIASRKGKYSFLLKDNYNKFYFDYSLFRALMMTWRYKGENAEDLIISEIKNADEAWLDRKLDELELFVAWKDLRIDKWKQKSLDVLVDLLIKSEKMDYHGQRLITELGRIKFDFVIKIIQARLDFSEKRKKSSRYYDAIPMHLDQDFMALIKENKDIFKKKMVPWILSRKEDYFNAYECGSLLQQLNEIHVEIIRELIRHNTMDAFDKAVGLSKSFDQADANILFEIAESIVNSGKIKSKEQERLLGYIGGSMFSTGVVSGEHGLSDAYKNKAQVISEIKKELEKYNKPKELVDFADKLIKSLKERAKSQRIDEERDVKMREIEFDS